MSLLRKSDAPLMSVAALRRLTICTGLAVTLFFLFSLLIITQGLWLRLDALFFFGFFLVVCIASAILGHFIAERMFIRLWRFTRWRNPNHYRY
ncbi:MAG: hypothetical protein J5934_07705 [Succinivibrio sp.]|nr:hypothetical protein [Succinivibrio sp.]